MFRINRAPKDIDVMPDTYTFEEAIGEVDYRVSLGRTGVDTEVEFVTAPDSIVVAAGEDK